MNQEVTEFISAVKEPWQAELCGRLRDLAHGAIPGVQERLQYKKPHFLKNGKYAAVITPSKDAVGFTIFNAEGLRLPDGKFEGPPERKTIKFRRNDTLDAEWLSSLVRQAAETL
ncbi:DUF1801 domain-containing protein [Cohnella caldifontis]|uniref:DUF1801 domain-containing protein n=1 Tax=Cohnella caldifontis TaxID=3027471 RepID=UPI0023ED69A7|nr:DUF1801 domain-containing protein [Cohnella sp. YIM B05605]